MYVLFESFLENEDGQSRPWVIELDPTTACNLRCHGYKCKFIKSRRFQREIQRTCKEFVEIGC